MVFVGVFDRKQPWKDNGVEVARVLGITDLDTFLKWWEEREYLGYEVDYRLIGRAYHIWREHQINLDHLLVMSGREGYAKTTTSTWMASWVTPHLDPNEAVVYKLKDYLKLIHNRISNYKEDMPLNSIIVDEGANEMFSRDAMSVANKILAKTLFMQRFLKMFIQINIPSFHFLDTSIKYHRCRTLIEMSATTATQSEYKGITGKGIKMVSKQGKDFCEILSVKLPQEYFWEGWIHKKFSPDFNFGKYTETKIKKGKEFIENCMDEVESYEKRIVESRKINDIQSMDIRNVVPIKDMMTITGLKQGSIVTGIRQKRVLGNKILGRWYIDKTWFYENVLKIPIAEQLKVEQNQKI